MDTLGFLTTLYAPYRALPDARRLWIEVRTLAPGREEAHSRHFSLGAANAEEGAAALSRAQSAAWNVYVGVLPRVNRGRYAKDCLTAAWLWAEADGKEAGQDGALSLVQKSIALGLPAPHLTIGSGGGVHLYWRLAEPVPIRSEDGAAQAEFKATLRRLAYAVGGLEWGRDDRGHRTRDLRATHPDKPHADATCAEAARILRVPGTLNHKRAEPRPVTVLEQTEGATWTYARWRDWLPAQPAPAPRREAQPLLPGEVRELPARTMELLQGFHPEGTRHEAARKVLASARFCGFDESGLEMLGEIMLGNHPGWKRAHMEALVRDTARRVTPTYTS